MSRFLIFAIPVIALAGSDFDAVVRPILEANCAECHSTKIHTSGFSIASPDSIVAGGNKFGVAVVPGSPEKSALVKILKGELSPRMPFGKSLSGADIATIEHWVQGLGSAPVASAKQ